MSYRLFRQPQLATINVRGLNFQLYRWTGDDPQPLVFAHGWGDNGETFQFVVDHLSTRRSVVAFDARGFGRTEWPQDGYWFPDYLADLEAVLDFISPERPVDLLGHSMGGNVAMMYAGIRPQRVRRLINLEGFGLRSMNAELAPARYREWLDEVKEGTDFATYNDFEQFEKVLARRNPRTPAERIAFIARSWARQREDGRVELVSDPRHKRVNPVLYQRDQTEACWREIIAPVLFVIGGKSEHAQRFAEPLRAEHFAAQFRSLTTTTLPDAGHMLHHEFPVEVAELIEQFFR
ncbi:MAG TPA: alpha/beta hydrolase [Steroidobacteraceae bacterium]|nr:alpha/beta hydrolase [Steroidobacteraceae bacterium]